MKGKKLILVCWGTAIVGSVLFLLIPFLNQQIGYPLDDAWIHQTFARNLAFRGEWAVNPGEITAGSTSPLWTLLLTIGYVLHLPQFVWTFSLGVLFLGSIIWLVTSRTIETISNQKQSRWKWLLVILLVGTEWHLLWAAVSGMEILFFAALAIACLLELTKPQPLWWLVGLLAGIIVWVRPDGITLVGPLLVALLIHTIQGNRKISIWLQGLLPFGLLAVSLLAFNYVISGNMWPNTFAAKQVEYSILQKTSFMVRLLNLAASPIIGSGIFLLAGIFLWTKDVIHQRKWIDLILPAWVVGFIGLYAWRLPVSYQHGRYLMPVIPVILVMGLLGLSQLDLPGIEYRWKYIFARVYLAALVITSIGFLFLGIRAYVTDVTIIQDEMVASATWVRENTPTDALIAAHDIGALGYFGEREILDLAGLINPEIIPILPDSTKLSSYIIEKQADYLIVFPHWYKPPLNIRGKIVFTSRSPIAIENGGEHLTVYQIDK
jgi:hypothetical protein